MEGCSRRSNIVYKVYLKEKTETLERKKGKKIQIKLGH